MCLKPQRNTISPDGEIQTDAAWRITLQEAIFCTRLTLEKKRGPGRGRRGRNGLAHPESEASRCAETAQRPPGSSVQLAEAEAEVVTAGFALVREKDLSALPGASPPLSISIEPLK